MDRIKIMEIYDRLCEALTDYEETNNEKDLYVNIVEITNKVGDLLDYLLCEV